MRDIRVNYITGNKGNVGKTGFANAMIEFYRQQKFGLIRIDADHDSQTLSKMYDDTLLLALSDNPALASQADVIFRLAYKESQKTKDRSDILVDLPAGGEKAINDWMKECGLDEEAKKYGITFVKWWVCDSDPNSIDLFEASLKKQPSTQHIFLKNMGRSVPYNWESFKKKKPLQSLIKKESVPVLEIPRLDPKVLNGLREQKVTLQQASDKSFLSVNPTDHLRVNSWLFHTGKLFKDTIPFDQVKETAVAGAK